MANLSQYYPAPIVAGTTLGTYADGASAAHVSLANTFAQNQTLDGTNNVAPNQTAASGSSLMTRDLADARYPQLGLSRQVYLRDDFVVSEGGARFGELRWVQATTGTVATAGNMTAGTGRIGLIRGSATASGGILGLQLSQSGSSIYGAGHLTDYDMAFGIRLTHLTDVRYGFGWAQSNDVTAANTIQIRFVFDPAISATTWFVRFQKGTNIEDVSVTGATAVADWQTLFLRKRGAVYSAAFAGTNGTAGSFVTVTPSNSATVPTGTDALSPFMTVNATSASSRSFDADWFEFLAPTVR